MILSNLFNALTNAEKSFEYNCNFPQVFYEMLFMQTFLLSFIFRLCLKWAR